MTCRLMLTRYALASLASAFTPAFLNSRAPNRKPPQGRQLLHDLNTHARPEQQMFVVIEAECVRISRV